MENFPDFEPKILQKNIQSRAWDRRLDFWEPNFKFSRTKILDKELPSQYSKSY